MHRRTAASGLGILLLGVAPTACSAPAEDESAAGAQGVTEVSKPAAYFEASLATGARLTIGSYDITIRRWDASLVVGETTYPGLCNYQGTVGEGKRVNAAFCRLSLAGGTNDKLSLVVERPAGTKSASVAWVRAESSDTLDDATKKLFAQLTHSEAAATKSAAGEELRTASPIAVSATNFGPSGDSSLWEAVEENTKTLAWEISDYPRIKRISFWPNTHAVGLVSAVITTTDGHEDDTALDMRDPAARKVVYDDYR